MAIGIDLDMAQGYSHIQALELELEQNESQFRITCEQEASRRLRIDLVFLQEENADLQAQLLEKEEGVDLLEEEVERQAWVVDQLNTTMNELRVELSTLSQQLARSNADCEALKRQQQDSAKIIEEKLALSRELDSIRPEIEHLRAQQATNANALSEKLALQRELQNVQDELENAKRTAQDTRSRDSGHGAKLQSELENLKSGLTKEKAARQELQRESRKLNGESAAQNAALELRLEEYRTKLKGAKEQIKNTRTELEESRKANERLRQESKRLPSLSQGKRSFSQVDADATIGTPDGLQPKRPNRASALLGERSEFPITPFLNPTARLNLETPIDETQEEQPAVVSETVEPEPVAVVVKTKKMVGTKAVSKPRAKQSKTIKATAQKKAEQLEDLPEEDEDPTTEPFSVPLGIGDEQPPAKIAAMPKKKRRVLGAASGKTLFDDDDMGTGKIDSRGGLDDFKFAMPKRIQLAAKGATALGVKGKATAMSGFGGAGAGFSPLKKDRRQAK